MAQHRFLFELPLEFFAQLVAYGHREAKLGDESEEQGVVVEGGENSALDQPSPLGATPLADAQQPAAGAEPQWGEAGSTCITCGIGVSGPGFSSAAEQRAHYKTDWHRYNVKRRLEKKPPVEESAFEALLLDQEHEVSSISGSSSSDSDSDDDAPRAQGAAPAPGPGRAPQAVFQAPDGKLYAVWRCLLLADQHKRAQAEEADLLATLRRLRGAAGYWALLMLRGGHFAAALFRLHDVSGLRKGHAQDAYEVAAHKTFHRYVVRAKAGGKQSAKDGTGKFARSAGARLRRHNEAALQRDIAQLLADWRPLLASAQLLFVSAPSSNMQALMAASAASVGMQPTAGAAAAVTAVEARAPLPGEQQAAAALVRAPAAGNALQPPLVANDARVRRVPFITQRPTFSELKRVVRLLGSVRETEPLPQRAPDPEDQRRLQQQAEALAQQAAAALRATTLVGDSAGLGASGEGPDDEGRAKQEEPPLIKAARAGDADRVARLLDSAHDPTVHDARGRTAYQLASSKEVRDALRRFMAAHPDRWDYTAAGIPSALTAELEAEQAAKKADKRARQKAREAERKAEERRRREAAQAAELAALDGEIARAAASALADGARASGSGRGTNSGRVGGAPGGRGRGGAGASAAERPLTAEEQARRREVMAAAAEARMKALQAAAQQQALW